MASPSCSPTGSTSSIGVADLVRQARRGDREATELLFSRYRPYLRVICTLQLPRFCQKREDESDIVQSTLLDAMRGLSDFRGDTEGEFEAWMAKVLERNILQCVRRNTANKRDIRREVTEWHPSDSTQLVWRSFSGDARSPESTIFRGEAALELAQALEQLPSDQRTAVELRYLGQQPLKGVAEYMSKTTSSVAGLIYRGVENLRELLPQ